MTDIAIVSTARTPIAKAYRGAFNATPGATLAAHAVRHAVERAALDKAEIDDVILGCAMPRGTTDTTSPVRPRSGQGCRSPSAA